MIVMQEWSFVDEIRLTPLHLSRAALLMAREIAYPELDIDHYLQQLRELSLITQDVINPQDNIAVQAEVLASFLFKHFGFQGNSQTYTDPRNSFLNDVLDRQVGIPITLSLIFIETAQRLGIPAQGVGMPGHFIVSVQDEGKDYFFDPFHGGGRLSVNDCARLVEKSTGYFGPFQPEWLQPTRPHDILIRILNNLRLVYVHSEGWEQALKTLTLLCHLQPDVPQHLRDLGLIYYRTGRFYRASRYLDGYLQRLPQAEDADILRQAVGETLASWSRMN
jgi:regulator of sirC expression with transglutaminase-like and TPR domain